MHRTPLLSFRILIVLAAAILLMPAAGVLASGRTRRGPAVSGLPPDAAARMRTHYAVVPLVSDRTNRNLVNPWGLARGPSGPWWVADNGTDTATLFDGNGVANPLVVSLPAGGAPTGLVFNIIDDAFIVRDGEDFGPAFFIFASEDGRIFAWNPQVPRGFPSPVAFEVHDGSASGAIYKGLALATTGSGSRLYATDFHNGRIDVLDREFQTIDLPDGAFVDPDIPVGFAPFGIQNIQGRIFVTYAKQDRDSEDDVPGPGLGFVSAFDTDGVLLARIATRGLLNAPWGLTLAPEGFGRFGGDLLVGNFGDGRIIAFNLSDDLREATVEGALRGVRGRPLAIEGLWALGFGNNLGAGSSDTLFFTAGPGDEQHGLFGKVEPR